MNDLIAKMLQACDGPAPNLYADLLVVRDELERLQAKVDALECVRQAHVDEILELKAALKEVESNE